MKKNIVIVLLCAVCFNSQAQTKPAVKKKPATMQKNTATTTGGVVLNTSLDSLSYALGVLDATFFKAQGVEKINYALMNKGFEDVLRGKNTLLNNQQCDMTVREQLQAFMHKKSEATIAEGEKFLAENKKREGVKVTPSGLQYEVIKMGDGPKPSDTSTVKVHYEGFLINGKKFDSSRDRGEAISFGLNQVIRGWTEGVQLMPVGSRFKFYIPYTLGYGEQGSGSTIPGGSMLIFDVELLGIGQ
ncbi:MAG: FKBP-type peptidyl-prolyl cis-trans isomerase [Chitinophagaceae bacterium]|nr:FKBP-type peptidyl-prolyl cis-trans isomerase [Chitinophagaceae bacterium]